jgi:hypothetical protein
MSVTLSCLCSYLNFLGHGEYECRHSLDFCFSFTSYEHAYVLSETMILSKSISPLFGYCRRWIWAVCKCLHICILDKVYGGVLCFIVSHPQFIVRSPVPLCLTSSWHDQYLFSASSCSRQAMCWSAADTGLVL